MATAKLKPTGILSYFPKHLTPRQVQIDTLLQIEQQWRDSDVLVVNLPVASGKSAIAATLSAWTKSAAVITPNNLLVEQYRRDYPALPSLLGAHLYKCTEAKSSHCVGRKQKLGKHCKDCPYVKDLRRLRNPYARSYIVNYYMYMAVCTQWTPSKYMSTLIVDEAHNLIPFLQDIHSLHLNYKKWRYPTSKDNKIDRPLLKRWVESLVALDDIENKGLQALHTELSSPFPKYILKYDSVTGTERATGIEISKPVLKMVPIDISEMPEFMWPKSQVNKIVLMSATVSMKDVELLGLGTRRISYIEADSCIPAENRPVVPIGTIKVSQSNMSRAVPEIAKDLIGILENHPEERGLVHMSYDMAQKIRPYLKDQPRLLFHNRQNKTLKYQEFRDRLSEPVVLVASGMYEGIDLPDNYGHFQVVTKVPWPYLGEPAVRYRAQTDKDWYAWETVKSLLQACGRICRGPEDYGLTYILDDTFERLLRDHSEMLPKWWIASINRG